MKQITLQMIIDKILDDAKGNMGCGIILLAFLGAIIIMAGASIFSVYIIIPFLFFGVPGIVLLLKSRKNRKKSKNKSFYIVTDVCCDKKAKYDSDGDSFFLTFEKNGTHYIDYDDLRFCPDTIERSCESFYINTQQGDIFYLIYLEGSKTPDYVFPKKLCELDMSDFEEKNGRISPKHNNF